MNGYINTIEQEELISPCISSIAEPDLKTEERKTRIVPLTETLPLNHIKIGDVMYYVSNDGLSTQISSPLQGLIYNEESQLICGPPSILLNFRAVKEPEPMDLDIELEKNDEYPPVKRERIAPYPKQFNKRQMEREKRKIAALLNDTIA